MHCKLYAFAFLLVLFTQGQADESCSEVHFTEKQKQKQANKIIRGNKRKEFDEVSVAWAPLLRILWKPIDS